jgi:hypothetical protein
MQLERFVSRYYHPDLGIHGYRSGGRQHPSPPLDRRLETAMRAVGGPGRVWWAITLENDETEYEWVKREFLAAWKRAPVLFDVPLDPLAFRVSLAPHEMGGYNRHCAYTNTEAGFICLNRHCCHFDHERIVLSAGGEDVIVHERTHTRQAMLLGTHHIGGSRGKHRDLGWYQAVSEACPKYLGAEFPGSSWPASKSVRRGKSVGHQAVEGTLDEPTLTHWPQAMRPLVGDPSLPSVSR